MLREGELLDASILRINRLRGGELLDAAILKINRLRGGELLDAAILKINRLISFQTSDKQTKLFQFLISSRWICTKFSSREFISKLILNLLCFLSTVETDKPSLNQSALVVNTRDSVIFIGFSFHFIFLFNYKARDNTNKKSQFTMQFGPA